MHRLFGALGFLTVLTSACKSEQAADQPAVIDAAPGTIRWAPPPGSTSQGHGILLDLDVTGDSVQLRDRATRALRGVIRAAEDTMDAGGVCAMAAAGAGALAQLRHALPIDTTAPWLAVKRVRSEAMVGTRALLPGAQAAYLFEGLFTRSRRRISLQWPVVSAAPLPAGAPDSVIERAIRPTASDLDAAVRGLAEADGGKISGLGPLADPDPARATPLVGDLPVHEVHLDAPCTRVTLALPVLARVDKVVRIPVQAGDTITAMARVDEGTVRLVFDEVPPQSEPRERRSIPQARVVAAANGRVTLRVRVQVVPRAQSTGQLVTLLLDKRP